MKKFFVLAFTALAFCIGSNAQTVITNNYGSPISGADGQSVNDDDDMEGISSVSLTYYEGSVFGANVRRQNWNAAGFEFNLLVDDHFDTFQYNINVNYSFGLWKDTDKAFLLTLAGGPALCNYKESVYKSSGKIEEETKTRCNLFVDPYLTFKVNRLAISAGYAFMFNKWKFKDRGEAFHVGLGYTF